MSHHHKLDEHYVTLLSNNSMDWYPKNTLSSFTNNLPVGLGLNSDWVVGITDLYITKFHPPYENVVEFRDEEGAVTKKLTELHTGGKKYVYHAKEQVLVQSRVNEEKFKTIFIYCDIIKPRIIGDSFVKCIKMLHVLQEAQYITFPRVEYHPLSTFCFSDITLLFQDDTSNQIRFQESYKPTACTLHFKKISQ